MLFRLNSDTILKTVFIVVLVILLSAAKQLSDVLIYIDPNPPYGVRYRSVVFLMYRAFDAAVMLAMFIVNVSDMDTFPAVNGLRQRLFMDVELNLQVVNRYPL